MSLRICLHLNNSEVLAGDLGPAFRASPDPANGSLPQRLELFLRKDGDVARLLSRHMSGEGSASG